MLAVKNSTKRQAAFSPARAIGPGRLSRPAGVSLRDGIGMRSWVMDFNFRTKARDLGLYKNRQRVVGCSCNSGPSNMRKLDRTRGGAGRTAQPAGRLR